MHPTILNPDARGMVRGGVPGTTYADAECAQLGEDNWNNLVQVCVFGEYAVVTAFLLLDPYLIPT